MKLIPLTRGKVATVSDEDFEWLSSYKWRATRPTPTGIERWYAVHTVHNGATIYMHREIMQRMGFPKTFICDHKDSDGLNNQRENLRPCSAAQNVQNRRKQSGLSSRFKGVYWHKRDSKWMARVQHNRKQVWLGYFDDEQSAAKAYDQAARKRFGQFARLNT